MQQHGSTVHVLTQFALFWLIEHHRGLAIELCSEWHSEGSDASPVPHLEMKLCGVTREFRVIVSSLAISQEEIDLWGDRELFVNLGRRIDDAVSSMHEMGAGFIDAIAQVNLIRPR